MKKRFSFIQRVLYLFVRIIGWMILHIIGHTSLITFIDKQYPDEIHQQGGTILYALWHNRFLYFAWLYRGQGFAVPVSESKDGEYIAQMMQAFAMKPVRGSSSRGGLKAIAGLISILKKGIDAGITPDGPRGPKYTIQPGVFIAAQRSGAAIVPISYCAKKVIRLNSWDNFIIPLPFNHFVVQYGKPLYITTDTDRAGFESKLYTEMMRITEATDSYFKK